MPSITLNLIKANDGTWKSPLPSVNVGGTWLQPSSIHIKKASGWTEVFHVEPDPPEPTLDVGLSGSLTTSGGGTITASVSNGHAPYSYSDWDVSGPAVNSWSVFGSGDQVVITTNGAFPGSYVDVSVRADDGFGEFGFGSGSFLVS